MNDDNNNTHTPRTPWQSPEITTLCISQTEQLQPPDPGQS